MFKKKKIDDTLPHVKYTKYGFPYIDVDNFLKSEEGKELLERMKLISDPLRDVSVPGDENSDNKSS